MNLSESIQHFLDSEQGAASDAQVRGMLENAAELLDAYRFVTYVVVLPDSEAMHDMQTWAPNKFALITLDQ